MERNYQVRLGWPLTIAYGLAFSRDSMHTSDIITQPSSEALPVDRTYYRRS